MEVYTTHWAATLYSRYLWCAVHFKNIILCNMATLEVAYYYNDHFADKKTDT